MTAKKAFALVAVCSTAYLLGIRYLVHQVTIEEVSNQTLWTYTAVGGLAMLAILGVFVRALIKTPPVRR